MRLWYGNGGRVWRQAGLMRVVMIAFWVLVIWLVDGTGHSTAGTGPGSRR